MSVAIIADCHVGDGGPGGGGERLVAQLDELPARGCRRLVLLGDVFHFWIGSRRFETPEIRRVVQALERLRGRGVVIDYVEGNRDFFIEGGHYATLFDRLALEVEFEAGGRRCLAVHGDGLNDRDRQYLFWRWLSKSPLVRAAVLGLPASFTRRLAHATEERLADTNFKHRTRVPEEAIITYGERRLDEGYDVLYLGHFHDPQVWPLENGEIRLLEAWFHRGHVEWLED